MGNTPETTWIDEAKGCGEAIVRALAHTESNPVKGAYDRGDRLNERVRMMQWWAVYLDDIAIAPTDSI